MSSDDFNVAIGAPCLTSSSIATSRSLDETGGGGRHDEELLRRHRDDAGHDEFAHARLLLDGLSLNAGDAHLIFADFDEDRLQVLGLSGCSLHGWSAECQKAAENEKARENAKAKERSKRPPHVSDHEPSLYRPSACLPLSRAVGRVPEAKRRTLK